MKNYTIIPKKIIEYKSNSKLLDIYTFACIKSKMDYKKGISKINKKTLSNVFNIPERTSSNTIIRLEEQKLLTIERKLYENKNANIKSKTILKNYYKFDLCPEHYFFVCNEFLTSNLPKEIKGFLLIIKAICLNNTNFYKTKKTIKDSINKSELSKLINMDIKTIEKYLNLIKGLNEIAIIENSIILKNNYFPLRVKENGNKLDNRKTEIINTILEICNNYNAMIPLINEQELKRILIYYPYPEKEIEELNNDNIKIKYSLKNVLNERIKSLPTQLNTEYILKVLNIPKSQKKENVGCEYIMI